VSYHSIESLRQKSEQRRAELKETISQLSQTLSDTTDEIKTTLSPRHLTEEARSYAKERGEQVVDTIRENVVKHPLQAMAIGAVAAYPLLGLARKVPVPLALIGAGLLLSRKGGGSIGTRLANGKPTNGEGGFSDAIRLTLAETQNSVAAVGTRAKDAIASGAASAASGAASAAADVADRATRAGEQAGDTIARLVQRNPLIIGGVAMAVGGFIAASLPASRMEERAVGEAGAALKRSGRKMTAEAIKSVKARVAAVADDMSAAAHAEGLTPEALDEAVSATADKVRSVAERAVDAALEREPNDRGTEDSNDGDENARF
jgi:hypothetical protein